MAAAIDALINEVRLLYHTLVQVGDDIHGDSNISMGMRGVLEYLDRHGPATVPDMARARRVTRQRVQTLVNALMAQALVVTSANPVTRRSPLIALTAAGSGTIHGMRRREERHLRLDITERRLREATATLRALREKLDAAARDRARR